MGPLAIPMTADSALANNNNNKDVDFDDEETPDLVDTQASTLATTTAAVGKDAESDSQPDKKNPTTIITGFLGAGKSAPLDYILTESTTLRRQ
ncbi:hypothetical protein B0O80DRAFT_468706 [Mortierella sp. GBAus27b]|nr:hypothetical protein B0O80DRAFT_468706 [Mortierella sp. GBAus27b]